MGQAKGIQMTDVSGRLAIHYTDHEASQHLSAFVAEHQSADLETRCSSVSAESYDTVQPLFERDM